VINMHHPSEEIEPRTRVLQQERGKKKEEKEK
jgi:hypothetical protein